jgi:hypothetical protein
MAKQKPKARLEDLEVREVSLVDLPANKRPFLIIKRREDMPRRAIPASEAEPATVEKQTAQPEAQPQGDDVSFFDVIGIGDNPEATATPPADPTAEPSSSDPPAAAAADEGGEPAGDPPAGDPPADPEPSSADPAEEPTDPGTAPEADPPAGDPPAAEPPVEAAPEPTETVQKAAAALDQATDLLARLTGAVNVLKGLGDQAMTDECKAQLEGLAGDLAEMSGAELGEIAKATDPALRVATGAMETMISQVAALQKAGDGDVPETVPGELAEVAKAISSLVQPEAPEPEAEPVNQAAEPDPDALFPFEVFKAADADPNDPDPELLIKAGAKMKKARLSQFAKAVEALQSILKELKGEPQAAPAEKVQKGADAGMLATLTTMIDSVKTAVTTRLDSIEKSVGEVGERVDKIENTRPAGNGEGDPPVQPVKKNDDDKNFWSGVL